MELRIYFRHLQRVDSNGIPQIYTTRNNSISPLDIVLVNGTVPQTVWKDMTDHVSGLDKLRFTWTSDRGNEDDPALNGAYQQTKGASGSIVVEGEAYQFIKDWCEDHVAARLNEVEVRVEDTDCGIFSGWTIGSRDLESCDDGGCSYSVSLRQRQDPYHCIQKTVISDNWQGWFQEHPTDGKLHPRFNYCNEIRPNGILIVTWYLLGFISAIVVTVLLSIIISTGNIGGILTWVFKKLNIKVPKILKQLSVPGTDDLNAIKKQLRVMYIEAAGCGRVHPAPLIRDYIENVCKKCGVKVDEYTAPIFFSRTLRSPKGPFLEASSGVKTGDNPHYNACFLTAPVHKGVRLYSGVGNLSDPDIKEDTTTHYITGSSPIMALSDLLHQLKTLYNAEWRIKYVKGEPYLYFWRKDWFHDTDALYDLSIGADDRDKLLEGVCYEWSEVTYPAYTQGLYASDAIDVSGDEARDQMGGVLNFGEEDNKLLEGELKKQTPYFGATRFRLDGSGTDYLYDAMQQLVNSQILQPNTEPQLRYVNNWIRDHVNYGLLLKDDTCSLPKVLIWDEHSGRTHAKCVKDKVPMSTSLHSGPLPEVNERYNTDKVAWADRHKPKVHVKGNAISFSKPSNGVYDVLSITGHFTTAEARLVNYPMYFEPYYKDTLWDWYHWIDDPRVAPRAGKNWSAKIELCCEDLKRLRLVKDEAYLDDGTIPLAKREADDPAVGDTVKLPLKHYPNGIISEIEVVYDHTEKYGKHIQLKGTV